MTPEEISKAKERIKKLLNMTTENGCTEDESESAMRMAAGLATRIGIELESLRQSEPTAAQRKAIRKGLNQEFKIHQVLAAQAAAVLYGCDIYVYDQGKGGLYFIGREENVELTEQTSFWLMRQVELLYKQSLPKGMTQKARAEFRKTFKAACANRIHWRAVGLMKEMKENNQAAQSASGSNALVVQGYFDQLAQENRDYFKPTPEQQARTDELVKQWKTQEQARRDAMTQTERDQEDREKERERKRQDRAAARRKGPRGRSLPTGNGTDAGLAAGDRVQLRKEIG